MGRRRRQRHSAEYKATVIAECMKPGVSVAAVALAHSLNANMLRKWVIDAEHAGVRVPKTTPPVRDVPLPGPSFVPLALTAPPVESDIRIDLHRSGTTISIAWPAAAARECAAWLSDWLR